MNSEMTENEKKYFFSDFTTENYRKLLKLAKANYTFTTYQEYSKINKPIIWRHDVDFSMHRALKLAQIEKEEGIVSTYFVLLHSEFYNLLEKEITILLNRIIELGHPIGLHFDASYYGVKNENELKEKLFLEKKFLEKMFSVKINSFCFHITSTFTSSCYKTKYAGMTNAFSKYFQKEFGYCSDSNGYWRFKRLEDVLTNATDQRLQVLTHPELWQDKIMSPKQRVYRCADIRAEKSKQWYNNVLEKGNRKNIDW